MTPVPSSELAKQGYPTGSQQQQPKPQQQQLAAGSIHGLPSVSSPLARTVQSTVSSNGSPALRPTIIQQVVTKPNQQLAGTGAATVRPQQRIIQQIVRPGQILPNGQQLIIQNGKPMLISAPTSASAALPTGKIVLTQKGQVLQGSQAAALAGKIINTPQGQFIMGPNGQLLSTQKLIQNHLSGQTVRYVSAPPAAGSSSSVITTTAVGSMITTTSPAGAASVGSPLAGQKVWGCQKLFPSKQFSMPLYPWI